MQKQIEIWCCEKDTEINSEIIPGTRTKNKAITFCTFHFFFLCFTQLSTWDPCVLVSKDQDSVLNFDQKHIKFVFIPFSVGWDIWVGNKISHLFALWLRIEEKTLVAQPLLYPLCLQWTIEGTAQRYVSVSWYFHDRLSL